MEITKGFPYELNSKFEFLLHFYVDSCLCLTVFFAAIRKKGRGGKDRIFPPCSPEHTHTKTRAINDDDDDHDDDNNTLYTKTSVRRSTSLPSLKRASLCVCAVCWSRARRVLPPPRTFYSSQSSPSYSTRYLSISISLSPSSVSSQGQRECTLRTRARNASRATP